MLSPNTSSEQMVAPPSPPPNPKLPWACRTAVPFVCLYRSFLRPLQICPQKKPPEPPTGIFGKGTKPLEPRSRRRPGQGPPSAPPCWRSNGAGPVTTATATRPSGRRGWRHRGAPGREWWRRKAAPSRKAGGGGREGAGAAALPGSVNARFRSSSGSAARRSGGEAAWPARTCSSPASCWWVGGQRAGGAPSRGQRARGEGGPPASAALAVRG